MTDPPMLSAAPSDVDAVDAALDAIASAIRRLVKAQATGDLAALRRLDPEHPETMAFLRLTVLPPVGRLVDTIVVSKGTAEALRRLAAITQIMALRPDGLRPWGLGQELAHIGSDDKRAGKLLTARGVGLRNLSRTTARRLARDAQALPHRDLGRLILFDDWREPEAEEARMSIARDFARAERSAAYNHAGDDGD